MTAPTTTATLPRWNPQRTAWTLTGGLAAAAWAVLVAWDWSPWARLLDHDGAEGLPNGTALAAFIAMWALMLGAMMLPTTAPLLGMFLRLVAGRGDRRRLTGAVVAGYASVWTTVGLVAYAADELLHAADDRWSIIGDRGWLLVAVATAAAGIYQVTSLKDRCLTECRTPAGMIMRTWRGTDPTGEAYRIGASHGWSCVGCCWALMLIMFAVGAGNLGWPLALAAVMTVEKTTGWGAALTRPLGAALLAAAAAMAAAQL